MGRSPLMSSCSAAGAARVADDEACHSHWVAFAQVPTSLGEATGGSIGVFDLPGHVSAPFGPFKHRHIRVFCSDVEEAQHLAESECLGEALEFDDQVY